jgi:hypothetical protein
MTLVPELDKIRQEIEAVNADAAKLTAGLTEEQLAWRPEPGRWSIGEIFTHLNLATQTYVPGIDTAIATARKRRLTGSGPFGLGVAGKLFVAYLEPPYRMKSKAPKMIKPILQGTATAAVEQFLRSQQLVLSRLEAANGLDLRRAKFISPFASVLRMNLLAPFASITSHQRRHLWQAWHVRRAMEQGTAKSA